MGPEAKIHKWLKEKIKEKYPKASIYKPRGGTYGKKGVSDFICCINGMFIAIEVKTIENELTEMQQIYLDEINSAEGIGLPLYGKDEGFIDNLFAYIDSHAIQRL